VSFKDIHCTSIKQTDIINKSDNKVRLDGNVNVKNNDEQCDILHF